MLSKTHTQRARGGRAMKAYKFRASSQFDATLDIIFNRRLYCADWSRLNDPMEGRFVYAFSSGNGGDPNKEMGRIIREKERLRVCSLSKTFTSHLLWAHYASGFDGLAIEVELPAHPSIREISYISDIRTIEQDESPNPRALAQQVLTSKYSEWKYEKEVRILQEGEFYSLTKSPTAVLAGHRMKPALLRALEIVCSAQQIPLKRIDLSSGRVRIQKQ